jgi:osmotically-inducible protein OsmY
MPIATHRLENAAMEQIRKADAQVQRDVLDELEWDARVDPAGIGVAVKNGVVTLTGTVQSWTTRLAAQEAAQRVAGVLDVANDIQVTVPSSCVRSDADIAQAVRHALEWDVSVPHDRIQTTVSDGSVTLQGKVDLWTQYEDAGRCVRNLTGVRSVLNLIEIQHHLPKLAPLTVRSAIEQALARHALHATNAVKISVVDDKVVLEGTVPSWAERKAIEGAVRGTPGVHHVDSRLHILN